jgi:MerR family copper efflux transcriptional regulator
MALKIGQLAGRAGVSADTIRYYERVGLLPRPARSGNGYRQYGEAALRRVLLVRAALRFGFSVKEVAGFLGERDTGGAPCRHVRDAADRLADGIDRRIAVLDAARKAIRKTLKAWDQRLRDTPPGARAHLLEALPGVFLPIDDPQLPDRRTPAGRHGRRVV